MKNIILSDKIELNIEKIEKILLKYKKKILDFNKIDNDLFNEKIKNIDIFNLIKNNKLLLYEPIEYYGFLYFIDINFNNYFNQNKNLKILIDTNLFGLIEIIKYKRQKKDIFYISEELSKKLTDSELKFLINLVDIKIISNIYNEYFDIILLNNINNEYKLYDNSIIISIYNILNINNNLISNLNKDLLKFNSIELISPTIISDKGEFIIIYSLKKILYNNIKNKFKNFLKNHILKVNNLIKLKINIDKINNFDLKNKFIIQNTKKLISIIFNLMISLNIPVKTSIKEFYDNKFLTISNKLYSSLNLLSFQFINYENINLELSSKIEFYNNLDNISINLNYIKSAIDTRNIKKWYNTTYNIDNYKLLSNYIINNYKIFSDKNNKLKVSNAFLKIYELLITYPLINDKPYIKTFHFCEAPGMFIFGLNHFLNTKTNILKWDWYANSLSPNSILGTNALQDDFNLIKNYKKKWLYGPDGDGDIRLLKNIDYFKDVLKEVDFITSDCGICVESDMLNNYEEMIAEIDFAQFLNVINLLCNGGSCVLKMFIPLKLASNVSIVYTMTQLFEEVYISKPITSRPYNSEIYLICINYRGRNELLISYMKNLLDKNINPNFNPNINWINNIPFTFIKQLEDYLIEITRQQISYLLNIFYFLDNKEEIDKLKNNKKLKEETNKIWCKKFKFESNNKLFL